MLPAIIDVEASGFGKRSYPIEVGVVLPDGASHCFLIKPDQSWTHWDEQAEALHGITRETLRQHGKEPAVVASALNRLLAGQTIYTDAWSFDLSWLGKLHDIADVPQRYRLDTLRGLLSEVQSEHWHEIKARIVIEMQLTRHRASADARIIQETFRRSLEESQALPRSA